MKEKVRPLDRHSGGADRWRLRRDAGEEMIVARTEFLTGLSPLSKVLPLKGVAAAPAQAVRVDLSSLRHKPRISSHACPCVRADSVRTLVLERQGARRLSFPVLVRPPRPTASDS
jgi:hypothetical protein